jgi:hypothetical protein
VRQIKRTSKELHTTIISPQKSSYGRVESKIPDQKTVEFDLSLQHVFEWTRSYSKLGTKDEYKENHGNT